MDVGQVLGEGLPQRVPAFSQLAERLGPGGLTSGEQGGDGEPFDRRDAEVDGETGLFGAFQQGAEPDLRPHPLAWIVLRELPGLGTFRNLAIVGFAANATAAVLPAPHGPPVRIAYLLIGLVALAFFDAFYVDAQFGSGPATAS